MIYVTKPIDNRPRKWKKSAQPSDRKVSRAHAAWDCVTYFFVVLSLARHCPKIPWHGDGRCNMSVPLTGYGWFWYLGLWIFLWVMDGFGTVFKYWNLDHVLYLTSNLWSKQWTIVERESDTGPSVLLARCSYCFWIADASPWPRLTSRGRKWTDSLVAAAFVCRAWPGRLDDQKEITM